MSGFLLDTNVLCELNKPKPSANVQQFLAPLPLVQLYISTVTLAEIRFGIEQVADSTKRMALRLWLDNDVRPLFG